jgi:hypothetical protein
MDIFGMSIAGVLTRLRCLFPYEPMFVDPDTGERSYEPITEAFANYYLESGLDAIERHANWGL